MTPHLLELVEPLKGTNVHDMKSKLPPAPPSSQETVPVGIIFVPVLESTTFAVNVVGVPTITATGGGVTIVVVVRPVSVSGNMPELAE